MALSVVPLALAAASTSRSSGPENFMRCRSHGVLVVKVRCGSASSIAKSNSAPFGVFFSPTLPDSVSTILPVGGSNACAEWAPRTSNAEPQISERSVPNENKRIFGLNMAVSFAVIEPVSASESFAR